MTIRALYPWSEQWVPVTVRKGCLWWHDGPVGFGARVEIDWRGAAGGAVEAQALRQRLRGWGYRSVRLRPEEQEVTI